MDQEQKYVRLPGRGQRASFFARTRCTLWLASDHLLQEELSAGYCESAKRFYFRDIQALILVKTTRWATGNLILGILTGVFLLLAALAGLIASRSGSSVSIMVSLLIIAGLFGLIFLLNLLPGPTCTCHLQTAVHREELPSLRRLRRAQKVIARLQPLIARAQGALTREEVAAGFQAILQENQLTDPAAPGRQPGYVAVIKPYRSGMHRWVFNLLLVDAVILVAHIYLTAMPVILLTMIIRLALLGAVILALVKQDETDLKPALKSLTWMVGGLQVVTILAGYLILLSLATTEHLPPTQWGYLQALTALKPQETPWLLDLLVVTAGVSCGLAVWGHLLLAKHGRDQALLATAPPATPPKL